MKTFLVRVIVTLRGMIRRVMMKQSTLTFVKITATLALSLVVIMKITYKHQTLAISLRVRAVSNGDIAH